MNQGRKELLRKQVKGKYLIWIEHIFQDVARDADGNIVDEDRGLIFKLSRDNVKPLMLFDPEFTVYQYEPNEHGYDRSPMYDLCISAQGHFESHPVHAKLTSGNALNASVRTSYQFVTISIDKLLNTIKSLPDLETRWDKMSELSIEEINNDPTGYFGMMYTRVQQYRINNNADRMTTRSRYFSHSSNLFECVGIDKEELEIATTKEAFDKLCVHTLYPKFKVSDSKVSLVNVDGKMYPSLSEEVARKVFERFKESGENWIKNTPIPTFTHPLGLAGMNRHIWLQGLGDEWNDFCKVYNEFTNDMDEYVLCKEISQAVITAYDGYRFESGLPTLRRTLSYILNGYVVSDSPSWISTGPGFETVDRNVTYTLDLSQDVPIEYMKNTFMNDFTKYDECEDDIIAIHPDYIDIKYGVNFLKPFICIDTKDYKSMLPGVREFKAVVETKLEDAIKKSMDFSHCTMDNISNYMEIRKRRIEALRIINAMFTIAEKLLEALPEGHYNVPTLVNMLSEIAIKDTKDIKNSFISGDIVGGSLGNDDFYIPSLKHLRYILDNWKNIKAESDSKKLSALIYNIVNPIDQRSQFLEKASYSMYHNLDTSVPWYQFGSMVHLAIQLAETLEKQ